jgi:hypothetical protein
MLGNRLDVCGHAAGPLPPTPGLGLGSPGWKDHRNLRKRLLVAWCGLRQELSTTAPRLYAQHVPGQLYLVLSLVLSFFHLSTLITPRVVFFGVCLAIFVCCKNLPHQSEMVSIFGRGLIVATCALSLAASASAFNVTIDPNTVTQCGPTHFNWAGGTPPFSISCIVSGVYECGGDCHGEYRLTLAVLVFKALYS